MSKMKPLKFLRTLSLAIVIGFIFSFLFGVVEIVLAINDPAYTTSLNTDIVVWICGTAIALIAMLWRDRKA